MQEGDELRDPLTRALAYPYAIPHRSFLLAGGSPQDVRELDGDPLGALGDSAGRTPLLAYGSNASPQVLARKLGTSSAERPVLARRTTLRDFDVVYSAHISRYGSIPATLHHSPGTEVAVFVLYLTDAQLELISPTEPNYELVGLRGASCALEGFDSPQGIVAYLSRHGPLLVDGAETALSSAQASGRRLTALTQEQALEHVRTIVAPEVSLEQFVRESASDPDVAARHTAALKESQRRTASNSPSTRE